MPLALDTDKETEELQLERYRSMTASEKLEIVVDLNRTADAMAALRLVKLYGPLEPRELTLRLAALRLDRETMIKAFGWDPEEKGL